MLALQIFAFFAPFVKLDEQGQSILGRMSQLEGGPGSDHFLALEAECRHKLIIELLKEYMAAGCKDDRQFS